MTEIQSRLFVLQDEAYRDFQSSLIPNIAAEKIIGVRIPVLRKLAKELSASSEADAFLQELPHEYYDENNLHAFLIERIRDFEQCAAAVDRFLPFVNNWATCDSMRPAVFKLHRVELAGWIEKWIASDAVYAVRFAIGMLMVHFLDGDFSERYVSMVAQIRSDEYYIRMMQAWYFATALAKQWDAAVPYIEKGLLELWVHNKTIQKAAESRRISAERKAHLKTLKAKS